MPNKHLHKGLATRWLRFLRWFCPPNLYEGIEGDLLEQFEVDVETLGDIKARRRFKWNVLRFFRPGILMRNSFNRHLMNTGMFGNHLKVSYRQLTKNRAFTIVNVLGLSLGMSAAFLIYQYVGYEKSYESLHANKGQIYRVTTVWNRQTVADDARATTVPWSGPSVKDAFPEVLEYTRFAPLSVFTGEYWAVYNEVSLADLEVFFADPGFLKIFSFKLLQGDADLALSDPFSLVITASSAAKFFGSQNPMGKLITIDSHGNLGPATFGESNFKVTGVIQDPPGNSHMNFDFLISYSTIFPGLSNGSTYWHWDYTYTYLLIKEGSNIAELENRISKLRVAQHGDEMTYFSDAIDFRLQPISDIHLHSALKNELKVNGDGNGVFLLQLVMIGILLSAYINYINLSTVKAIERSREIGVRKIIGSTRRQLVGQLLVESALLKLLSVIVAFLISASSILFIENAFELKWPAWQNGIVTTSMIASAIAIVVAGILLSVVYPVLIITRIKVIEALKGGRQGAAGFGRKIELRKVLIVVQFVFCVAFTTGTWSLYQQLRFMKDYDLGMNMDQVIVVKGYGSQSPKVYESFKSKLNGVSFVESVGFSSAAPGDEVNLLGLKANVTVGDQTEPKELKIVSIDEDFFNTLEIALLAGRSFDPANIADQKSAIVNESAARLLGFEDPFEIVDEPMHNLQEVDSRIVGVIKNYNQLSLKNSYEPIVYVPYKEWDRSWNSRFFFVKVTGGTTGNRYQEALAEIEAAWKEAAPEQPFQYFFLDSHFENKYQAETVFTSLFLFFSLFAIIIACLGLFGLVAYSTIQRTKEIGIRKVLGATVENILALLSKDFFRLILVASLLAVPIVWLALESWLNTYAFRIDVDLWLFIVPLLSVFGLALATVILRSWRVAVSNPVNSLRYE
ncbi:MULTISPECIES: ABC transporter permease [unclassified Imperialibacter]|uniref:ABC transporter permease n=1 Tax=unclassified Imperialibacter TaxID=2629706 RepID=UPI001254F2E4|nr:MULTISPECIES: ABC transporter permease [unclassified Imperialibacter]CAD5281449.1 conserved membrane hypothetical protein [Imperialibacter sp. 89]CAD5288144.1 conserved membrane hypothetical protein [Imperialibacter sp. 75]VVT31233.1 putative ABC transporter permease [Imperialibacter sp. EC-SDR9]